MVDAMVSNTIDFTVVRVRVSLPAQHRRHPKGASFFYTRADNALFYTNLTLA
jgi:hypothetical protein